MIPVIMFLVACIGYVYTIIIYFNDDKNGKK
jgi:hypothetical protein